MNKIKIWNYTYFKVIHFDGVVLVHFLIEQRHRVPDEQMSYMLGHLMIDIGVPEFFVDLFIVHQRHVVKPAAKLTRLHNNTTDRSPLKLGDFLYFSPWFDRYNVVESYRDLGITNLSVVSGSKPLSCRVRQSTDRDITSHRQSTSVRYPRKMGDAAVKANWNAQKVISCIRFSFFFSHEYSSIYHHER